MLFQADTMVMIRTELRRKYDVDKYGITFVLPEYINHNIHVLKEWQMYQLNESEIFCNFKVSHAASHVLVFDLDNTLVTGESSVRLRCSDIIDKLFCYRNLNYILILWSYGNEVHVQECLIEASIDKDIFNIIICGGSSVDRRIQPQTITADINTSVFPVDLKLNEHNLPKSMRVILRYLHDNNYFFTKLCGLIDDKKCNYLNCDFFVNCKKCITPISDWNDIEDKISSNIENFNKFRNQ
jgi:viral phosphatase